MLAAANRDGAVALYQYVAEHDATAHADADQARHRLHALSPTEAELGRARARLANEALEPLARRLLRDAPLPDVEQSGR